MIWISRWAIKWDIEGSANSSRNSRQLQRIIQRLPNSCGRQFCSVRRSWSRRKRCLPGWFRRSVDDTRGRQILPFGSGQFWLQMRWARLSWGVYKNISFSRLGSIKNVISVYWKLLGWNWKCKWISINFDWFINQKLILLDIADDKINILKPNLFLNTCAVVPKMFRILMASYLVSVKQCFLSLNVNKREFFKVRVVSTMKKP